MDSPLRKTRIAAFNSLIGLNLALAIFAGLIVYLQFGRDVINIPNPLLPVVDFFGSNWEQFARVIGLCVLVLVFNVMGYLLGFDFLATQRPFRRLMLLHAQLPLMLIFMIASPGIMDLSFGLSIAIFLVILAVYATLAWQIERLFGKILTIMVRLLLAREKYIWSNRIAYLSILFRPNQVDQRKALGISRYETGDIPGTIKVLEPLVYNGFDDMQILEILEECYHVERQWDKVFQIEKREISIQPRNPVLRMRTARGLEKLQKYSEAAAILREGLPLPKLEYQELYFQNLFEMRDLPSAIEVVHAIENPRSRPRLEGVRMLCQDTRSRSAQCCRTRRGDRSFRSQRENPAGGGIP